GGASTRRRRGRSGPARPTPRGPAACSSRPSRQVSALSCLDRCQAGTPDPATGRLSDRGARRHPRRAWCSVDRDGGSSIPTTFTGRLRLPWAPGRSPGPRSAFLSLTRTVVTALERLVPDLLIWASRIGL